ncbi:hypothetical protein ONE63_000234 [Megalurothrips usitatus]|uniref:Uncharacterized protein n=1 Tax=Megalurothrips usitatus TaxID=439358 RepID=A0AAV7XYF2_9NEOP|nr:hypothetical protein ONE63_000234 [Megalurothrips usitatus]
MAASVAVLLLATLAAVQGTTTDFVQLMFTCEKDCKLQYENDVTRCGQESTCVGTATRTTTAATTTQWVNAVAACTADCKVQYDVDSERCWSNYNPQQCQDFAADAMSRCGCLCKSRLPDTACSVTSSLERESQNTAVAPTVATSGDVGKCYNEFRDLFGRCQDIIEDSKKCTCISRSLDALCPCRARDTSTASVSTSTSTTTELAPKPNPNIDLFIECNKVCWQETLDANDRSSVLNLAMCNCHCMSASGVTRPQLAGAAHSTAPSGLRYAPTADVLYCYKKLNKTLADCSALCNSTHSFPENCDWLCHKTFSEGTCRCGAQAAAGFGLAVVSVMGLVVWAVSP